MPDFQNLVERYIAGFNETDPARCSALIEQLYTERAQYTDPQAELAGREQIDAFIGQVQSLFPGYLFTVGSAIDAHHTQARFTWNATAPGENEPAYVGFDVMVAEDGQIDRVYGFIDKAPAA